MAAGKRKAITKDCALVTTYAQSVSRLGGEVTLKARVAWLAKTSRKWLEGVPGMAAGGRAARKMASREPEAIMATAWATWRKTGVISRGGSVWFENMASCDGNENKASSAINTGDYKANR